jgi:hypothetical protein
METPALFGLGPAGLGLSRRRKAAWAQVTFSDTKPRPRAGVSLSVRLHPSPALRIERRYRRAHLYPADLAAVATAHANR